MPHPVDDRATTYTYGDYCQWPEAGMGGPMCMDRVMC
jgi:hypothetical protein